MGRKLTEGVGLTSIGRDELPLIRGGAEASKYFEAVPEPNPIRMSRSSSLPVRYQENIPRPATGSGFRVAGAV